MPHKQSGKVEFSKALPSPIPQTLASKRSASSLEASNEEVWVLDDDIAVSRRFDLNNARNAG